MTTEGVSHQNGHAQGFKRSAETHSPTSMNGSCAKMLFVGVVDHLFFSLESDQHVERKHIPLRKHSDIHAFQRICMGSRTNAGSGHIYKGASAVARSAKAMDTCMCFPAWPALWQHDQHQTCDITIHTPLTSSYMADAPLAQVPNRNHTHVRTGGLTDSHAHPRASDSVHTAVDNLHTSSHIIGHYPSSPRSSSQSDVSTRRWGHGSRHRH